MPKTVREHFSPLRRPSDASIEHRAIASRSNCDHQKFNIVTHANNCNFQISVHILYLVIANTLDEAITSRILTINLPCLPEERLPGPQHYLHDKWDICIYSATAHQGKHNSVPAQKSACFQSKMFKFCAYSSYILLEMFLESIAVHFYFRYTKRFRCFFPLYW
jgi:hypothetical protein